MGKQPSKESSIDLPGTNRPPTIDCLTIDEADLVELLTQIGRSGGIDPEFCRCDCDVISQFSIGILGSIFVVAFD